MNDLTPEKFLGLADMVLTGSTPDGERISYHFPADSTIAQRYEIVDASWFPDAHAPIRMKDADHLAGMVFTLRTSGCTVRLADAS